MRRVFGTDNLQAIYDEGDNAPDDYIKKLIPYICRIEPDIKAQAEAVYGSFGISVTDAINVFLRASIMDGGFPFQPHRPRYNNTTLQAMQEARDIMSGKTQAKRYDSLSSALADIDAEEPDA